MRRASVGFLFLLLLFHRFTSISASIARWTPRSEPGASALFEIEPVACDVQLQIDVSRWSYEDGARIDFTIGDVTIWSSQLPLSESISTLLLDALPSSFPSSLQASIYSPLKQLISSLVVYDGFCVAGRLLTAEFRGSELSDFTCELSDPELQCTVDAGTPQNALVSVTARAQPCNAVNTYRCRFDHLHGTSYSSLDVNSLSVSQMYPMRILRIPRGAMRSREEVVGQREIASPKATEPSDSTLTSISFEETDSDWTCSDFKVLLKGEFSGDEFYSCVFTLSASNGANASLNGFYVKSNRAADEVDCSLDRSDLNITDKSLAYTLTLCAVYACADREGQSPTPIKDPAGLLPWSTGPTAVCKAHSNSYWGFIIAALVLGALAGLGALAYGIYQIEVRPSATEEERARIVSN